LKSGITKECIYLVESVPTRGIYDRGKEKQEADKKKERRAFK
jgi:hypothetical protein